MWVPDWPGGSQLRHGADNRTSPVHHYTGWFVCLPPLDLLHLHYTHLNIICCSIFTNNSRRLCYKDGVITVSAYVVGSFTFCTVAFGRMRLVGALHSHLGYTLPALHLHVCTCTAHCCTRCTCMLITCLHTTPVVDEGSGDGEDDGR